MLLSADLHRNVLFILKHKLIVVKNVHLRKIDEIETKIVCHHATLTENLGRS